MLDDSYYHDYQVIFLYNIFFKGLWTWKITPQDMFIGYHGMGLLFYKTSYVWRHIDVSMHITHTENSKIYIGPIIGERTGFLRHKSSK